MILRAPRSISCVLMLRLLLSAAQAASLLRAGQVHARLRVEQLLPGSFPQYGKLCMAMGVLQKLSVAVGKLNP